MSIFTVLQYIGGLTCVVCPLWAYLAYPVGHRLRPKLKHVQILVVTGLVFIAVAFVRPL
jgi:hypothetical protein